MSDTSLIWSTHPPPPRPHSPLAWAPNTHTYIKARLLRTRTPSQTEQALNSSLLHTSLIHAPFACEFSPTDTDLSLSFLYLSFILYLGHFSHASHRKLDKKKNCAKHNRPMMYLVPTFPRARRIAPPFPLFFSRVFALALTHGRKWRLV